MEAPIFRPASRFLQATPNEESRSASTRWTSPVRMAAPVIPPSGDGTSQRISCAARAGRVRPGDAAHPDGAVVLALADGDEGEAEDVGDPVADEGVDRRRAARAGGAGCSPRPGARGLPRSAARPSGRRRRPRRPSRRRGRSMERLDQETVLTDPYFVVSSVSTFRKPRSGRSASARSSGPAAGDRDRAGRTRSRSRGLPAMCSR